MIACGEPRYGTCWILTPAIAANSSNARCMPVPLPAVAQVSLPCLRLRAADHVGDASSPDDPDRSRG